MKSIPLTRGKVALVDDQDYEHLRQLKWSAMKGPHENWYATHSKKKNGKVCTISMHRLIMNAKKGMVVDHINGDSLDNRRENLRLCTNAENSRNRRSSRKNTSGYKGVTKEGKKYRAQIRFLYKIYRLGYFDTPEEAARAYDQKAIELFGPFARLNFPAMGS